MSKQHFIDLFIQALENLRSSVVDLNERSYHFKKLYYPQKPFHSFQKIEKLTDETIEVFIILATNLAYSKYSIDEINRTLPRINKIIKNDLEIITINYNDIFPHLTLPSETKVLLAAKKEIQLSLDALNYEYKSILDFNQEVTDNSNVISFPKKLKKRHLTLIKS